MRSLARALAVTTSSLLLIGVLPGQAFAAGGPTLVPPTTPANGSFVKAASTVSASFDALLFATSTISVAGPTGATCGTPMTSGMTVSCALSGAADGAYNVSYTAVPQTNPLASTSGTFSFTLDATAPLAPTAVTISPSPYKASDAALSTPITVQGTAEKGSSVAVTLTSSGVGSAPSPKTAPADPTTGAFSVTFANTIADGTLSATARATDAAMNQGPASTAVTAVKDTAVPNQPTATVTNPIGNANKAAVTVSGTKEAGTSVAISISDGTASPAVTKAVPADGTTAYSVTGIDVSTLHDGTLTVTSVASDAVGNASVAGTANTTKDVVAPALGSLVLQANTGASQVTAVPVSGTGEAAAIVQLSASDGTATPAVTKSVPIAGDGTWSTTLDLHTLADGTVTVIANATDAAGNTSSPNQSATTKKTSATMSGALLVPASTNASQASAVAVSGTGEGAAIVLLSATDGTATPAVTKSVPVASDGTWSTTLDLSSLADGIVTVTASAKDAAGNVSSPTQTATTKKDVVAPALGALVAPANAGASQITGVPVSGTGEAGATVQVSASDGTATAPVTKSVAIAGDGTWSTTLDLHTLADGTVTYSANAKDAAGNTSAPNQTASTKKDTAAPAVPTVSVPATTNGSQATALAVSGTGEAGATVRLSASDGTATAAVTKSASVAGDGTWSTTLDVHTLADGTVTVTAGATDAAGNTSASASTSTSKDTVGPAVTGLAATATNGGTPSTTVTGTVSDAGSILLSATDGTTTVTQNLTSVASGSFSGTLDLTTLKAGTVTVSATPSDSLGNAGTAATTTTTKDTSRPPTKAAPVAVAGDRTATVYFGQVAQGSTYRVTASPGGATYTGSTSPGTITGLTNGVAYTFTVRERNAQGNIGASSPASSPVVPKGTSRTVVNATPPALRSGTTFVLKGTVARPTSGGPFGTVALHVAFDNGSGAGLGSVAVASNGTFSKSIKVSANGVYTATYAGDAATQGSASAGRRTLANAAITASYTAKSAASSVLVVKGSVAPAKRGVVIYLNQILPNGRTKQLATQKLSATSAFAFSLRLPRGSYRLQLQVRATPGNAAGTSSFTLSRT